MNYKITRDTNPALILHDANGQDYAFYLVKVNLNEDINYYLQYQDEPLINRLIIKPRLTVFYHTGYSFITSNNHYTFDFNSPNTNIVSVTFTTILPSILVAEELIGYSHDMALLYNLDKELAYDRNSRNNGPKKRKEENHLRLIHHLY